MNILEISLIAAAIAFVAWMEWPIKPPPRCRVCGKQSNREVCCQPCQARLDMIVVSMETRELREMNFEEFGF